MYEFEVLLKNGETTFVYGYSEADFRKRAIRKGHADFLDQIEKSSWLGICGLTK